jgi:hypothetical protein
MDKALKVEIEKEIMKWYVTPVEKDSYTKNLTSALTALIIKWLEGKKVEVIGNFPLYKSEQIIGRNQLITELVEELK